MHQLDRNTDTHLVLYSIGEALLVLQNKAYSCQFNLRLQQITAEIPETKMHFFQHEKQSLSPSQIVSDQCLSSNQRDAAVLRDSEREHSSYKQQHGHFRSPALTFFSAENRYN
jgi:hypothetical protein